MHKFRRLYWFIRHQVFVSANSKFVSNNSIFRDSKVRVSTNSQFILGKNCLIENCNINNSDYLLRLPHYAMKKPINLINNHIISSGKNGIVVYYDDRTG